MNEEKPKNKLETINCKNCGEHELPPEMIREFKFNCCLQCGELYAHTKEKIRNYMDLIGINKKLNKSYKLVLKSELTSAVREACIVLEKEIRKISGLNSHGVSLASQAFSFKYDKEKDIIVKEPKIKLNDLSSETLRNEQEGIQFLTMGLFKGIRNIYMHTKGSEKIHHCLQIITFVDFLLDIIIGDFGTIAEDRTFFKIEENGKRTQLKRHDT
jgi:uncharacterized protein (TIGR02391 family)